MFRTKVLTVLAGCLMILTGTGCGQKSAPSNFFVLSPPEAVQNSVTGTTMRRGVSLGIGPVTIPEYLDRSQIVRRRSASGLLVDEFNRWGGDLGKNVTTVLGEVLSSELNTDRIQIYPWSNAAGMDYQVIVQITAFEARPDNTVVIDARWSLVDSDNGDVVAMARSQYAEPVAVKPDQEAQGTANYDAVANAMSANVASLGTAIARSLARLPR